MEENQNKLRALVTGGAGFVGVNVARYLAHKGHSVVAFDYAEAPRSVLRFVGDCGGRITWVTGDVRDRDQVRHVLKAHRVDTVIHAAAVTPGNLEIERERSRDVIDVNVMGTVSVLEASQRVGCRRVIVFSSSAAIGGAYDGQAFIPENGNGTPRNLYGISKLAQELLTQRYGKLHGTSAVTVRISQPYGPMERPTQDRIVISPIGEWMETAAAGRSPVVADGDAGKDWIYIDDLAEGVARLATAATPHYNLGFGALVPVREVLDAIRKAYPEVDAQMDAGATPNRNLLPGALHPPLEMSRLRDEFGFRATLGIDRGIALYADWMKAREKIGN